MVSRKISLLIAILCLITIFTGCANKPRSTENYNVSDLVDISNANDETEGLVYAINNKWKYDKHYSEDLFFNDYTLETDELTAIFSKALNQRFIEFQSITKNYVSEKDRRSAYSFQYFYDLDLEFYNSSLELYRKKELSSEELFGNEKDHIRQINLTVYSFMDKDHVINGVHAFQEKLQNEYFDKGIWIEMTGRSYDESILEIVSIEELSKMDMPFVFLEEQGVYKHINLYPKEKRLSSVCVSTTIKEKKEILEERYNEEFVFISENYETYKSIFAPKRNLELTFEEDDENGSKYPAVMVQKMVSKRVYEILEKNSAMDRMVFFTTVAEAVGEEKKEFDNLAFDFTKPFDDLDFVNKLVIVGTQTTFYYLYDASKEKIDYDMIYNIATGIQVIYPPKEGEGVFELNVYFIDIPDEKRKIAVELFKGKDHTENSFRRKSGGFDLSRFFLTRTDHEGFRFLDIYGKKDNKHMSFGLSQIKDMTVDGFVRKYTYEKNSWE